MKPRIAPLTIAILVLTVLCAFFGCSDEDLRQAAALDGDISGRLVSFNRISQEAFLNPSLETGPEALWCWLNCMEDHNG